MAELSEKIEQLEKEKCDLINKVDCLESVVNEVRSFLLLFFGLPYLAASIFFLFKNCIE
jgi:hypothetical protein